MDEPRIRATDNDRNQILAVLSQALSNGQLDFAEFDERSRAVTQAKYRDELLTPLSDLVPDPARLLGKELAERPHHSPSLPSQNVVTNTPGETFSFSLMGGSERNGSWTIATSHTSISVMGGTILDLTRAQFAGHDITIHAWAVMGGISVLVPEDVRVVCDGTGIMGGYGIVSNKEVTTRMEDLPTNVPTVRVTGLALMGGVEVKRMPRTI
ncbi:DUF1707 SHOCT-like domain-containing protein [Corynebacterium hindlerae]|uniref:DUF1707 SHOCT-like domain-containing protein n=1 Tax=Corynebacterium hindlerae TaxID=699041 RepID=UPI001FCC621F|nr:DUF1707 domain-containing protein [Corynebacterium hindlerae]